MKITALEEYGLRCLVLMASKPEGEPVTVAEIAEGEGLTAPYVGKLMAVLRQAGFLDSVRGRGGGYVLARPAEEISVEEVLNSLGEPLFTNEYCDSHPGALSVCTHQGDCSIRSVWQTLGEIIHRVLRGTSLADLCMQEARLASRFKENFPDSLLSIAAAPQHAASCGCAHEAPGAAASQDLPLLASGATASMKAATLGDASDAHDFSIKQGEDRPGITGYSATPSGTVPHAPAGGGETSTQIADGAISSAGAASTNSRG